MLRNKTIPALVVVLSLAAIASITMLQAGAEAGRDAQLKLATLKTELTALQMAPFKASARTGGSPAYARKLIDDGKQKVAATLVELRRSSPVPALARIPAPLRADYAAIDEIYAIGASGADYGKRADQLAGVSGQSMGGFRPRSTRPAASTTGVRRPPIHAPRQAPQSRSFSSHWRSCSSTDVPRSLAPSPNAWPARTREWPPPVTRRPAPTR